MAGYCPRCGARGWDDPSICWACSDGIADAARAEQLIAAGAAGSGDALRVLGDTLDPRAFEPVVRAAGHADPAVRRAALKALARIRDPRAIPAAVANLRDPDERIREAAIACLAELGPAAAPVLVERLDDPADRARAAVALAWQRDERAIEPLAMILDVDDLLHRLVFPGDTARAATASGWFDDSRALAVLVQATDRLLGELEGMPDPLPWQAQSAATQIASALSAMTVPGAAEAMERLRARVGRLYVYRADPSGPYRAQPDDRRTVPRWSFELVRAELPITDPVTKFGGQPVWLERPTWPIAGDGDPAIFWAQFSLPDRHGLAYLFLDPSAEPGDEGILFAQPGTPPTHHTNASTGPTFASELSETGRFDGTLLFPRIESIVVLEEGRDFPDWELVRLEQDRPDDHRDWNKVGGTPLWLQYDATPEGPGWRFLFQFTAALVGRELGDGAEAYGFIHEDGRGFVTWQSH